MSEMKSITIQKRNATGKGVNRRLRAAGIIPAVFYTAGGASTAVQVSEAQVVKLFESVGRTTIFNVELEDNGKKEVLPAIIWDIDYYPTKNRFQHIDFLGVNVEKDLKIRVPLEFAGTAKGTKLGGVLETFTEFVDVVGKPLSLPSKIAVDLTPLGLGQAVRVADLQLPEGVRAATELSKIIALVKDKTSGSAEDADGNAS